jgi:hypothetical protein
MTSCSWVGRYYVSEEPAASVFMAVYSFILNTATYLPNYKDSQRSRPRSQQIFELSYLLLLPHRLTRCRKSRLHIDKQQKRRNDAHGTGGRHTDRYTLTQPLTRLCGPPLKPRVNWALLYTVSLQLRHTANTHTGAIFLSSWIWNFSPTPWQHLRFS